VATIEVAGFTIKLDNVRAVGTPDCVYLWFPFGKGVGTILAKPDFTDIFEVIDEKLVEERYPEAYARFLKSDEELRRENLEAENAALKFALAEYKAKTGGGGE
jgi:hypothetical protein